jgi:tRNA dimethylallyltransferase
MVAASEILIITGPTACGKSHLALSIAQKRAGQNKNSVIINADSQQVYREIRILSARPTPEEEAQAPHRLYGFISVRDAFSVGHWLKYARMEIDWALAQGALPIVVGGTGMYIKVLMQGIADIPDIPDAVRRQAENDYDAMGKDAFCERLKAVDPEFFTRLTAYDRQRLVRAWAVWLASGKSLSRWQQQGSKPLYPLQYFRYWQVELPREELYRRCDARFETMIGQGALAEVRALLELGVGLDAPSMKSVGIKELSACITAQEKLEDAVAAAQQATRNYAKRQLTWLRHQPPLSGLKERLVIDNQEALAVLINKTLI